MSTPRFTIWTVSDTGTRGEFVRVEGENFHVTPAQAGISDRSIRAVHHRGRSWPNGHSSPLVTSWIFENAVDVTIEDGLEMTSMSHHTINGKKIQAISIAPYFIKTNTDKVAISCTGDKGDAPDFIVTGCSQYTSEYKYVGHLANFEPYGDYMVSFDYLVDGIYVYLISYDDEASFDLLFKNCFTQKMS